MGFMDVNLWARGQWPRVHAKLLDGGAAQGWRLRHENHMALKPGGWGSSPGSPLPCASVLPSHIRSTTVPASRGCCEDKMRPSVGRTWRVWHAVALQETSSVTAVVVIKGDETTCVPPRP